MLDSYKNGLFLWTINCIDFTSHVGNGQLNKTAAIIQLRFFNPSWLKRIKKYNYLRLLTTGDWLFLRTLRKALKSERTVVTLKSSPRYRFVMSAFSVEIPAFQFTINIISFLLGTSSWHDVKPNFIVQHNLSSCLSAIFTPPFSSITSKSFKLLTFFACYRKKQTWVQM